MLMELYSKKSKKTLTGAVQFFVTLATVSTLKGREEAISLNSTILAVDWEVAQFITHSIKVHTAKSIL